MIKFTNIIGLISIIYVYYNHITWIINANENNIISKYIVNILTFEWFPTSILIYLLIILYCYAIITNKLSLLMYIITICLLGILCEISLNILMLESTTNFILLKVTVPIPEELKLFYVQDLLMDIINSKPELLTNKLSLREFQEFLNNHLDLNKIRDLNAKQIREYIFELVNEKPSNDEIRVYTFIKGFYIALIAMTIFIELNLFNT